MRGGQFKTFRNYRTNVKTWKLSLSGEYATSPHLFDEFVSQNLSIKHTKGYFNGHPTLCGSNSLELKGIPGGRMWLDIEVGYFPLITITIIKALRHVPNCPSNDRQSCRGATRQFWLPASNYFNDASEPTVLILTLQHFI